ncbi:L-serine ammonia-lyase, iron-sulfur-dependent subunit beta [Paenibacillus sp. YPG26]|uniref:L-serine ammonia-lyase, iron-sulfur-dependent subunit beta n=1 Tax=Paenibacillus sp. YPG26 TaxID=2878915 RepID=UPI00203F507B|nr:L-serine ammonia-lyase, iron-sulfur-dependent subunit beta [Paenibacillus sp. YPG26]USB31947.1 L-serine ammonia-lyase, iron-sulfur-dependent subunit beta [Paenibacillus sp. YPG26]
MKFRSVFDIIGPAMIGPSSSHTAGAARIGRMARMLFGREPRRAEFVLYGSFAETFRGHGTDVALAGGILQFDTFDPRIKDALLMAKDLNIDILIVTADDPEEHPNTARITLTDDQGSLEIKGVSIGGGKIEIKEAGGFEVNLTGDYWTMLVFHEDHFGMIASIAQVLADHQINIGSMHMSRKGKGQEALLLIETDQPMDEIMGSEVEAIPDVHGVRIIAPL